LSLHIDRYNRQAGRRLDLRLDGSIESAIPENPLVGPNISSLSAIQADL